MLELSKEITNAMRVVQNADLTAKLIKQFYETRKQSKK